VPSAEWLEPAMTRRIAACALRGCFRSIKMLDTAALTNLRMALEFRRA
jgi:hypothetical protein